MLGVTLNDLGRKEDAINDFIKVIEINPQYAYAYYNKGILYYQYLLGNSLNDLGRKEDAIKDYTKVIGINPQYAYAYYNRGRYYYQYLLGVSLHYLGNYYTKAIEIIPQYA